MNRGESWRREDDVRRPPAVGTARPCPGTVLGGVLGDEQIQHHIGQGYVVLREVRPFPDLHSLRGIEDGLVGDKASDPPGGWFYLIDLSDHGWVITHLVTPSVSRGRCLPIPGFGSGHVAGFSMQRPPRPHPPPRPGPSAPCPKALWPSSSGLERRARATGRFVRRHEFFAELRAPTCASVSEGLLSRCGVGSAPARFTMSES